MENIIIKLNQVITDLQELEKDINDKFPEDVILDSWNKIYWKLYDVSQMVMEKINVLHDIVEKQLFEDREQEIADREGEERKEEEKKRELDDLFSRIIPTKLEKKKSDIEFKNRIWEEETWEEERVFNFGR